MDFETKIAYGFAILAVIASSHLITLSLESRLVPKNYKFDQAEHQAYMLGVQVAVATLQGFVCFCALRVLLATLRCLLAVLRQPRIWGPYLLFLVLVNLVHLAVADEDSQGAAQPVSSRVIDAFVNGLLDASWFLLKAGVLFAFTRTGFGTYSVGVFTLWVWWHITHAFQRRVAAAEVAIVGTVETVRGGAAETEALQRQEDLYDLQPVELANEPFRSLTNHQRYWVYWCKSTFNCTVEARSEPAQVMMVRQQLQKEMRNKGVRFAHIATTVDRIVELAFTPLDAEVNAQYLRWSASIMQQVADYKRAVARKAD
jgi:hypothetical protein